MQLVLEIPENLADAGGYSPERFAKEAKLLLAIKMYELGRLSSGVAAKLAGLGRVEFLATLSQYDISIIQTEPKGLETDIANA